MSWVSVWRRVELTARRRHGVTADGKSFLLQESCEILKGCEDESEELAFFGITAGGALGSAYARYPSTVLVGVLGRWKGSSLCLDF